MNYPKSSLTILISVIYFYLFNNPNIIKICKIKTDNINYIVYTLLYLLTLYFTIKFINYMIKDDITEHFNYKELINSFKKNMEGQMKVKKDPKENLYCKEKLREIINDIDDDSIKLMIENYGMMKCKNKIDEKKLCHKLDMSKYVLKDSVPDCSKVLAEQYGLYKSRPGDVIETKNKDTEEEETNINSLINKKNYIIYYLLFVFLVIVYIVINIGQSIFSRIH